MIVSRYRCDRDFGRGHEEIVAPSRRNASVSNLGSWPVPTIASRWTMNSRNTSTYPAFACVSSMKLTSAAPDARRPLCRTRTARPSPSRPRRNQYPQPFADVPVRLRLEEAERARRAVAHLGVGRFVRPDGDAFVRDVGDGKEASRASLRRARAVLRPVPVCSRRPSSSPA